MVFNLIVVDEDPCHDWVRAFRKSEIRDLRVYQSSWPKLSLRHCAWNACVLDIEASDPDNCINFRGMDKPRRSIRVDFMLIRNYPKLLHGTDFTNLLLGLHFSGVRSVNSIWSIIQATNRAILYASLNEIKRRVGDGAFPFIEASFHANLSHEPIREDVRFPCVAKIASSCAGYGKMRIKSRGDLNDLKGILELHNDFYTLEPFCPSEYDIRLQGLGEHLRAYKRVETGDAWKRNTAEAGARCEDIDVTPRYRKIAKEISALFGGLDIFTVDLLRLKDGSDVILEINDSGSGIWESKYGWHSAAAKEGGSCGEDNERIRDIVVKRVLEARPDARKRGDDRAVATKAPSVPRKIDPRLLLSLQKKGGGGG
eukprot:g887.t1